MDLKVKRISWMGNIYQKFEAVCQEVDDIVGQDAVKYLENRVQNVGDSMKKLCSGVVHELLPFPNLETPAKYEAHSVALKKNVVSSVKSVGGGEDNNKNLDEENPINNFIKALQNSNAIDLANDQQAIASDSVMSVGSGEDSNKSGDEENPVNNFVKALQDSNAIDLANDQQAGAPDKHEHVNQVSSETRSDYLEVEDSYITQDEVGDDSREAAGVKKESMHASIEETAINSASVLMNLISVEEKEPVEFSIDSGSYSGSSDSVCGVSVRTKDSKEVVNQVSGETRSDYLEVEDSYITQDEVGDDPREVAGVKKESMHASIEETAINSTSVLMNLISVEEKEPVEFSIDSGSYSGSSDSVCGVLVRTKDSKEVNVEQDSCLIVEENNTNSSAADKHEHVNQVSSETRSDYLEVEDSYITQDEVGDDSREAAGVKKESMHASIEETAINSASVLMNLISVEEKEPVEFSIDSGSYSGSSDSVCGVSVRTKDSKEVVNQVSGETRSDYLEVEDSYITQDEVGDDPREVAGVKKESMHASIEETAINSTSVLMNLISVEEKEPVEFSIDSGSYSGSSDSVCGVLVRTKDSKEVNVEQDSCLIVEENNTNSSAAQVLNFTSLGEKELIKASLFSESSDVDKVDTGILAKVSPAVSSVSCERPITKTGPLCFKSSLYLKSQGSWSFEIESCKNNSGDVACCNSNSSMVHICCKSPQVAGQVMESHDGLVSSCRCQSKESNDESPVCSVESRLEDIQLNDDTKLGESCVFVDDSELHAVSCRAQKLRSYKKRIQDVFTSKKRLAKEYEQLAIWYGDTDMEPSQDLPRTLLPFRSRTHANSKHLQLLQASETEWELL